jgi:uncharacterized Fe-S cluster protein YjdI
MRKTYSGAEVDVSFDPDVCIHAAYCVTGLPAVFDTGRRPWILPDGASPDEVVAQVARCPSGALQAERRGAAIP